MAALAKRIAANSPGSIAAYKDLYRAAANSGLADGLAYEANTEFDIPDTRARVEAFMRDRLG